MEISTNLIKKTLNLNETYLYVSWTRKNKENKMKTKMSKYESNVILYWGRD
jgi:hypothetical protein